MPLNYKHYSSNKEGSWENSELILEHSQVSWEWRKLICKHIKITKQTFLQFCKFVFCFCFLEVHQFAQSRVSRSITRISFKVYQKKRWFYLNWATLFGRKFLSPHMLESLRDASFSTSYSPLILYIKFKHIWKRLFCRISRNSLSGEGDIKQESSICMLSKMEQVKRNYCRNEEENS